MKKVAVMILNYKVKDLSLQCVKSVQKSTYLSTSIYLVDNCSGDGIEEAAKSLEGVHFIQTGSNLGFTGGNNIGIKQALKDGADFVFILNPDTTVDSRCISECLNVMADEKVGIAGPKVLFNDRKTIWYAGGILDKDNVIGQHRGIDEVDQGQYNVTQETDYATGAAVMVRREVFERVGLFDEKYFLYYEDSDLCFRVKGAGFKIMYVPLAVVYHKNAQSTGLGSPLQDYYITRNRMLFAGKFLSFKTRFALLREAMRNLSISSRRGALVDFLLGRFGKGNLNA